MAEYTYDELKHMTVADLRTIASGIDHEAVKGYTQLHKDQIVAGICTALDIDTIEHHDVVGIDKAAVKAKIRQLKVKRDEALESGDHAELKRVRRALHRHKRNIRKHYV